VGKDDRTDAFRAKSVVAKLPLLETPDGALFESNAIARYIAKIRRDTELTGKTFFESAQVDAWQVSSFFVKLGYYEADQLTWIFFPLLLLLFLTLFFVLGFLLARG